MDDGYREYFNVDARTAIANAEWETVGGTVGQDAGRLIECAKIHAGALNPMRQRLAKINAYIAATNARAAKEAV